MDDHSSSKRTFYFIFPCHVSRTKVLEVVVDMLGADLSFVFKS